MKFELIEEHKSNNPTPLIIRKGTRVNVGKRSDGANSWPNWIYCYSLDGNSEGWTPEQIIQIESEYGIVLEDYSAKELGMKKGEIVEGNIELNGWVWCSKLNGSEEGWLPKEKIVVFHVL
ncbi:MAG TPA: SH3 domain-containing protein [Desulfosporosinus sp.]|nr:SH3 domain-containing protein [Desulfosporosinus sp.]